MKIKLTYRDGTSYERECDHIEIKTIGQYPKDIFAEDDPLYGTILTDIFTDKVDPYECSAIEIEMPSEIREPKIIKTVIIKRKENVL